MNRPARSFTFPSSLRSAPLLAALAFSLALLALTADAAAQSLQQRIDHVRQQQQREQRAQQQQAQAQRATIAQRLGVRLEQVQLQGVPAREAFAWWSRETSIPLVIDWDAMLLEGVEPEQPITIQLQHVPAAHLLRILMQQASPPEVRLIHEATPWYMRVMTRRQANREMIVQIYDVNDLVMVIPNFDEPPQLGASRGQAGRGGGRGGGRTGGAGGGGRGGTGGGLFGDTGREDADESREQQGEALVELVRETIEPDIWAATAGGEASVRYFDGRLIVRAPRYVHRQIGRPVISLDRHNPLGSSPATVRPSVPRADTNRATPPRRSTLPYRRRPGIGPPSRSPSGIVENH